MIEVEVKTMSESSGSIPTVRSLTQTVPAESLILALAAAPVALAAAERGTPAIVKTPAKIVKLGLARVIVQSMSSQAYKFLI